jgi:hypothetical protein
MEAGKKRLAGDTARAANTDEVKELRRGTQGLEQADGTNDGQNHDSHQRLAFDRGTAFSRCPKKQIGRKSRSP